MTKIGINIKAGSLQKKDRVVGIDLGTTNSLVAIIDSANGQPKVLGKAGELLVPSIIYFNETNQPIIGDEAKKALISHPESTIFSVKRLLGKSYKDIKDHASYYTYRIIDNNEDSLIKIECGGTFHTPVTLNSLILSELKQKAETILQETITKAVITVPAYFNDNQRQAVRDAGKIAGLDVLRIVNEPTAASLAYGVGLNPGVNKTVMVYDLGGGTFDVSILKIEQGIFEVLSTNGDTYLGGDDFDRAIAEHWITVNSIESSSLDRHQIQLLRLKAEEAKKEVCSNSGNNYNADIVIADKSVNLYLDTQLFSTLSSPLINKTIEFVDAAIKDAHINPNDIDEVILVGGSTRIPFIKTILSEKFNRSIINNNLNPDEVVALGAAVEADILAGNRSDILLLDVTPLSLGIETLGGLMDVLIPRNSKIPSVATRQYTTSIDGQVNMSINIYQGERELVEENRKLASFQLNNIPSMPAGLPKIDIKFMLDADGILKISATEIRSGVKQEIIVKPQYGLDDSTVEKMLADALQNAQSDVEKRLLLEHQNEAHQMIYVTERFIEKNSDLLTPQEISDTKNLISELNVIVTTGDPHKILSATEKLNEYTKPFAHRIMDSAINSALQGKKIDA